VKKTPANEFYDLYYQKLLEVEFFNDFHRGPGFISAEWASFGAPIFGFYLKHINISIPYLFSLTLGCLILTVAVGLFLERGPHFMCSIKNLRPRL